MSSVEDFLAFLLMQHLGSIIIGFSILIASFVVKNKLAQLILAFKIGNPKPLTINSSENPSTTVESAAPIYKLETTKPLNGEEMEKAFGFAYEETIAKKEKSETKTPTKTEKGSVSERLLKAARGERE